MGSPSCNAADPENRGSRTILRSQLHAAQTAQLAESAARAFMDDPASCFITPDEQRRAKALRWTMQALIRYGLQYGQVLAAENLDGLSVWLPPQQPHLSIVGAVRTGMIAAPLQFGCMPFVRLIRGAGRLEAAHRRILPEPHWYLLLLAVDPARQSQGLGGQLIQPGLARADAAQLPCYLETLTRRAVNFYQRHGFRVAHEGQWPHGPTFWSMVRPAAPKA